MSKMSKNFKLYRLLLELGCKPKSQRNVLELERDDTNLQEHEVTQGEVVFADDKIRLSNEHEFCKVMPEPIVFNINITKHYPYRKATNCQTLSPDKLQK